MKILAGNFKTYESATKKEWILTNKLGGYASSSAIASNTRRYHGLLVISKNPPVDRHLVLSKINETIITGDEQIDLYSHKAGGNIKDGYKYLISVDIGETITYEYLVNNVYIKKNIKLHKYKNRVSISYEIKNNNKALVFRMIPLFNLRYFHYLNSKDNIDVSRLENLKNRFRMSINGLDGINLQYTNLEFKQNEDFFYNMEYDIEKFRGLDYKEDHFIPGRLETKIKEGEKKFFSIDVYVEGYDYKNRVEGKKIEDRCDDDIYLKLKKAADEFIVYRKETNSKTILAGYPWFNDWGRDAMIALPGLLLSTNRYNEAKEVLETFGKYIKDGLIPNMLPDGEGEPLYNTVDASLWFIDTAYKYYKKTDDKEFLDKFLIHKMKSIIENYKVGTMYDIRMDSDGLITAGSEQTQLTWMDAKVGDFVVTPRHGKAIEINALWYNALCIMYELTNEKSYKSLLELVYENFNKKFVDDKYIYDIVSSGFEMEKSKQFRPNFLYSISLEYPVLEEKYQKKYIKKAIKELYTPYGIRSLSLYDNEYKGKYENDQFSRDTAYHQGTTWAYLIGPFIDAYIKVYADKNMAMKFLQPLIDSLQDGCIGNISEIFEGDYPHNERGCFAQAWSVGEVLRVYKEMKG